MVKLKEDIDYSFSPKYVFDAIKDYSNSSDPYQKLKCINNSKRKKIYGISIYNTLLNNITDASQNDNISVNFNAFHLLMEHKVLMIKRLKYLDELNELDNSN